MSTESWENITPKMAAKYLNLNTNNRPLRTGHTEKMVADINADAWTECVAPIIFFEDGSLADGQHRLWAIIESGKTLRFKVTRNYPKAAGVNLDTGITRTPVDAAHIQGWGNDITKTMVTVARGIEFGHSGRANRTLTITESLQLLAKHRDASTWACKHGPTGVGMRNAAILAAIARAWYIETEKERLILFSKVLSTGFADSPEDSAAIAMRNYFITRGQLKQSPVSTMLWRETFLKSQNAIYYFIHHKPLQQIKGIADETYPLPENIEKVTGTTGEAKKRLNQAKRKLGKK